MFIFFFLIFSSFASSFEIPFSIYHTNDLHSHFEGVKDSKDGISFYRGGYARIAHMIKELKKEKQHEIIFGVDAGDFFSGTVFSALAPNSKSTHFPEFDFFMDNGFELITFGNHEFDARNEGLSVMLKKAEAIFNEKKIPLLGSNLKPLKQFQQYFGEDKLIQKSLVREFKNKKGEVLRFGFLGALGPNGCLVSKSTRGEFQFFGFADSKGKMSELITRLKEEVQTIKQRTDIIILSIHGGEEEVTAIAKAIPEISIIIAGHTHKKEFFKVGDTFINQTGSYGENLGFLEFIYDFESKKLRLKDSAKLTIALDEKTPEDLEWKKRIEKYKLEALKIMGHTQNANEIIFKAKKDYPSSKDLFSPMGVLVSSGIREGLNRELILKEEAPIDVYFTSTGLIRNSFKKDVEYRIEDIFEILSIGFDEELKPGVDIVKFYVTKKEFKMLLSFLEIYSSLTETFTPVLSRNATYTVNKYGIPFLNRIRDLKINGKDIDQWNGLIHVGTNRFVSNNIGLIKKISYGIAGIEPKDRSGKVINDLPGFSKEYLVFSEFLRKFKDL